LTVSLTFKLQWSCSWKPRNRRNLGRVIVVIMISVEVHIHRMASGVKVALYVSIFFLFWFLMW